MARIRSSLPSPEGTAKENAVPMGGAEVARSVRIPPNALAALPLPAYGGPWLARWHLIRLALVVRRDGWTTQLRTAGPRHVLRVFSKSAPTIRESITVARADGTWWYLSTTGLWLTPCKRADLTADKVNILLKPWVAAAFDALRDES